MKAPIALLTDFGWEDPYVGFMKAVILSKLPTAQLVDLAHGIEPQNIQHAAFVLGHAYDYFPKGTLFVCVVDPGVGTDRNILCVKACDRFFIGPDNGLFWFLACLDSKIVVRSVENKRFFWTSKPAPTFHGRDIMAPVAAALCRNPAAFVKVGPKLKRIQSLERQEIRKNPNSFEGEILFFDHFGNAVTNIEKKMAPKFFWQSAKVKVNKKSLGSIRQTYQDGKKQLCALFNSVNHLELAYPEGSAKLKAHLKVGDKVRVKT